MKGIEISWPKLYPNTPAVLFAMGAKLSSNFCSSFISTKADSLHVKGVCMSVRRGEAPFTALIVSGKILTSSFCSQ